MVSLFLLVGVMPSLLSCPERLEKCQIELGLVGFVLDDFLQHLVVISNPFIGPLVGDLFLVSSTDDNLGESGACQSGVLIPQLLNPHFKVVCQNCDGKGFVTVRPAFFGQQVELEFFSVLHSTHCEHLIDFLDHLLPFLDRHDVLQGQFEEFFVGIQIACTPPFFKLGKDVILEDQEFHRFCGK